MCICTDMQCTQAMYLMRCKHDLEYNASGGLKTAYSACKA